PSGVIAIPVGPVPTVISLLTAPPGSEIGVTVVVLELVAYALVPSGETAIWKGWSPAGKGIAVITVPVATSIGSTSWRLGMATTASVPSGVNAIPSGSLPVAIGAP